VEIKSELKLTNTDKVYEKATFPTTVNKYKEETMVKMLTHKTSVGRIQSNECKTCDQRFLSEGEFRDHILTTVHKGPSDGTRNFKYRLTAKTAKSNLLKGARRKHFGIEHKQGASNIDFSDGAWIKAVFPEVLKWDKGNRNFSYGELNVEVIEAKPGIEGGNNHVDYKFIFLVNGHRVVLHAYNGKQRFTVCGQNYLLFIEKYLEPFFTRKIDHFMSEATKFNEEVLASLGKSVKRGNVKYKTATPLSCKQCNQVSSSISQLHDHMMASHAIMSISSSYSDKRHSTKNNSLANSLIIEDLTLNDTVNDETDVVERNIKENEMRKEIIDVDECDGDTAEENNKVLEDKEDCEAEGEDNDEPEVVDQEDSKGEADLDENKLG
jgi:hypothetical protein